MDAVPLGGRPPMAPLPPSQLLGFGTSRWRLQGDAILGLRAGGRGHHLFFLPHKGPLLAQSGLKALSADLSAFGAKRHAATAERCIDRSPLTHLGHQALLFVAMHATAQLPDLL